MVRVFGFERPPARLWRRYGEPARGSLAQHRRWKTFLRVVAIKPQTHAAFRRAEPTAAGVCSQWQTADARAGIPLVARPTAGSIVARSCAPGLFPRACSRRFKNRRHARQWRHAHPSPGDVTRISRCRCARPRHVGHAGEGQGLWRLLHTARSPQ